jgi:hypothetical protein
MRKIQRLIPNRRPRSTIRNATIISLFDTAFKSITKTYLLLLRGHLCESAAVFRRAIESAAIASHIFVEKLSKEVEWRPKAQVIPNKDSDRATIWLYFDEDNKEQFRIYRQTFGPDQIFSRRSQQRSVEINDLDTAWRGCNRVGSHSKPTSDFHSTEGSLCVKEEETTRAAIVFVIATVRVILSIFKNCFQDITKNEDWDQFTDEIYPEINILLREIDTRCKIVTWY